MRLWTFQEEKAYDYIMSHGVWYSDANYARRLKMVDEEYIQEEFSSPTGIMDTMPIYCFASMGRYYKTLSLYTMYSQYNHLVGWMQFPLQRMVMFELEVPEEFILSTKKGSDWYVEYPDMPKETRKNDRWQYAVIAREDTIEHKEHLKFKREHEEDDIESLIPCVKLEHIAAIRRFYPVNSKAAGYGTCEIKTVYVGKEIPLWTDTIYANGDSYPRVKDGEELKQVSLEERSKLCSEMGMCSVYPYMTVEEIHNSCAGFIVEAVKSIFESLGLSYEKAQNISYQELLDMKNKK